MSQLDQEITNQVRAIINDNNTAGPTFATFGASSARSHSASEYSFVTTDVDDDSGMSNHSEHSFALQPANDHITDLGLDGMEISKTDIHYWMDANHNQAVSGPSRINGIKREAEWEGLGTVAPNSVSPPEQVSSVKVAAAGSPEKEDSTPRDAKLERKSRRKS